MKKILTAFFFSVLTYGSFGNAQRECTRNTASTFNLTGGTCDRFGKPITVLGPKFPVDITSLARALDSNMITLLKKRQIRLFCVPDKTCNAIGGAIVCLNAGNGDFFATDGTRGNINTGHYTLLDGGEGNFYCDRLPERIYTLGATTISQAKSTPTEKAPLSSSDTGLFTHHSGDPSLSRNAATSATSAASPSSSEEPSDSGTSSSLQSLLNNVIFAVLLTTGMIAGHFLWEILV